jgi:hypothetical protein
MSLICFVINGGLYFVDKMGNDPYKVHNKISLHETVMNVVFFAVTLCEKQMLNSCF